ncbi:MAG: NfeD family protein [Myxococcota bacterium]|nr:NfeD family protein [Myxococcota bacterium]
MLDLLLSLLGVILLVTLAVAVIVALLAGAGVVAAGAAVERVADFLIPGRKTGLGAQGIAGEIGVVVSDVVGQAAEDSGTVQVAGEMWTARSSSGSALERGRRVRVVEVRGMTAWVEPEEPDAPAR